MANSLKNLRAWGDGKSLLLNFIAPQLAGLIDPLLDVFAAMRDTPASVQTQNLAKELAAFPGGDTWTACYHDHGELVLDFSHAVLTAMGVEETQRDSVLSMLYVSLNFEAVCRETALDVSTISVSDLAAGYASARETMNPILKSVSESLARQVSGEDDPLPQNDVMEAFVRNPAVKYMLCVFLPCAATWQTTPGNLLEKASKGDEKALERLLTLDKHVLSVPEVAAIYHDRMSNDFKRWQVTIVKYLAKSLPVVTRRKLEQAAGTFLHVLTATMGQRLAALDMPDVTARAQELNSLAIPEIQGLFTAFRRDSGTIAGHEQDADIADFDAYRQAIHRMRKDMPPPL